MSESSPHRKSVGVCVCEREGVCVGRPVLVRKYRFESTTNARKIDV